jgi:hypothetical protein
MTVSLRLDDQTAQRLEEIARQKGVSKSDVIRQCLAEYLGHQQPPLSPWELGKDLFGRSGSGRGDLSRKSDQIVREKIRAQRRGH